MIAATTVHEPSLRELMLAEHEDLAVLLDEVGAAFDTGDRDIAAKAFRELELRLADHLAFEDAELLPALAEVEPTEAAALAEAHRALRTLMTELGVGVDLHVTRASAIAALVAALREHAHREDALLYRWAEERFDHPTRAPWIDRLRTRVRRLVAA